MLTSQSEYDTVKVQNRDMLEDQKVRHILYKQADYNIYLSIEVQRYSKVVKVTC